MPNGTPGLRYRSPIVKPRRIRLQGPSDRMRLSRSTKFATNAIAGREVDLTARQDGSGVLAVLLGDRVVLPGSRARTSLRRSRAGNCPEERGTAPRDRRRPGDGAHDGAWTAVDPVWLETIRRTLRDLVSLSEKRKPHFMHPDGEDIRGGLTEIDVEA